MNRKLLLLPLLVLLASCDSNPSVSPSTNNPSTPDSSSNIESTPIVEGVESELELLKNSDNPTTIRDDLTVRKNNKVYLNYFTRTEHDEVNGIYFILQQESGFNDSSNAASEYTTSISTYYDGYYSYTLKSDNMYYKVDCEKEISPLEIGFNFDLIESLVFTKDGYKNKLEGIIPASKANEFLSKQGKEISDITFTSISNGENLESIELNYTQNGFDVKRTIEYAYVALTIEIPKDQK